MRAWVCAPLLLLLLLLLAPAEAGDDALSAAAAAAADPQLVARTCRGWVRGRWEKNGGRLWSGVPFAAPPVGDLRWRPPAPNAPWTGVLDANRRPEPCPQANVAFVYYGSEDCLYLNVWVPPRAANATRGPLPVLVWLYGGAFTVGDSLEFGLYNATELAAAAGAVVVTANYRLGSLGFLAHPGLRAESPAGAAGNYGLLDQRAALQWVQRNAAAFGGDPARVTVFGESAGGISVCYHLASPGSAGLFSRAIIESGDCGASQVWRPLDDALATGTAVATQLGCGNDDPAEEVACMRRLSTSKEMSHDNYPGGHAPLPRKLLASDTPPPLPPLAPELAWTPTVDGTAEGLAALPVELFAKGAFNRVPVIMGTNHDEGTIFKDLVPAITGDLLPLSRKGALRVLSHVFPTPGVAQRIFDEYDIGSLPVDVDDKIALVIRDFVFLCDLRRTASAMVASGHKDVWLYQFDYKLRFSKPIGLGTFHSSELVYVFRKEGFPRPLNPLHWDQNDWAMADTFTGYWGALAHKGDPSVVSGLPVWRRFDASTGAYMQLDVPSVPSTNLSSHCAFWDSIDG